MCDCKSYNKDEGVTPEKILTPPPEFGFTYPDGEPRKTICVDACIAAVIEHLWSEGVVTVNSCCGHNTEKPSLILQDGCSKATADKVRKKIAKIDNREFTLMAWNLVTV